MIYLMWFALNNFYVNLCDIQYAIPSSNNPKEIRLYLRGRESGLTVHHSKGIHDLMGTAEWRCK